MLTRLYIARSPQFKGKYKIGISRNVPARMQQLSYDLTQAVGYAVTVKAEIKMPFLFPEAAERLAHRAFASLNVRMPKHSGSSEWFRERNPVCLFLFLLSLTTLPGPMTLTRVAIAGVIFYMRYPVDGALFVLSMFVLQLVALVGVFYGAAILIH